MARRLSSPCGNGGRTLRQVPERSGLRLGAVRVHVGRNAVSEDRLVGHGFVGVSGQRRIWDSVLEHYVQTCPAVMSFAVNREFEAQEVIGKTFPIVSP